MDLGKYYFSVEEKKIIEEALVKLQHVDEILGKDGPLTRIIKCGVEGDGSPGLHGPLYEIQEALEIENSCPGAVKGFNITEKHLKKRFGETAFSDAGGKKIEFDIMTNDSLIECKDVDLTSFLEKGDMGGFLNKTKDHKSVAQGLGLKYQLRSAHLIPTKLKALLNQKKIEFIERCCKNCNNCLYHRP